MNQTTTLKATHIGLNALGLGIISDWLSINNYALSLIGNEREWLNKLKNAQSFTLQVRGQVVDQKVISLTQVNDLADIEANVVAMLESAIISISISELKALAPLLQAFLNAKAQSKSSAALKQRVMLFNIDEPSYNDFLAMLKVPSALSASVIFVPAWAEREIKLDEAVPNGWIVEAFYQVTLEQEANETELLTNTHYVSDLTPIVARQALMFDTAKAYITWLGVSQFEPLNMFRDAPLVSRLVTDLLSSATALLIKQYQFERSALATYGAQVLERFSGKFFDELLASSKLDNLSLINHQSALIKALLFAYQNGLAYTSYIRVFLAALSDKAWANESYAQIKALIKHRNLRKAIEELTGINDSLLLDIIEAQAKRLELSF